MKITLKKYIFYSLLICYSLVTTVGNIVVLRELLNSGEMQQQLSSEKKSRSIPDSPISIVKAHFLPSHNNDVTTQTTAPDNTFFVEKQISIVENGNISLAYSSLEFLPSKPRDPPII